MVIVSKLFHHFVHPDLRVEIFFKKEEATENEGIDFEIGDVRTSEQVFGGWGNFHAEPVPGFQYFFFFFFFFDKKYSF